MKMKIKPSEVKRFTTNCRVKGCNNTNVTHRMCIFPPKNEYDRKLKWFKACGNPELFKMRNDIKSKIYLCSAHFEDQFLRYKRLRRDAVPTLNLPSPIEISTALTQCIDYENNATQSDVTIKENHTPEFHSKISCYNIDDNFGTLCDFKTAIINAEIIEEDEPLHVPERNDEQNENIEDQTYTTYELVELEEDDYTADNPPDASSDIMMDIQGLNDSDGNISMSLTSKHAQDVISREQEVVRRPTINIVPPKRFRNTGPLKSYGKNRFKDSHGNATQHKSKSTAESDRGNSTHIKEFIKNFTVNDDDIFTDNEMEVTDLSLMGHDYCITDINSLCRLCGNQQNDANLLLDIFDEERQFHETLTKCFPNVRITMDKNLPRNACDTCVKFVNRVFSFIKQVKRVNRQLKSSYGTNEEDEAVLLTEDQKDLVPIRAGDPCSFYSTYESSHNANKLNLNFFIMRKKNQYFDCPFCSKCFGNKSVLVSHITLEHLNPNKKEDSDDNDFKRRCRRRKKSNSNRNAPIKMEIVESTNMIIPGTESSLAQFNEVIVESAPNPCLEYDDKSALIPSAQSNECTIMESLLMDIDQRQDNDDYGKYSFSMPDIPNSVGVSNVQDPLSREKDSSDTQCDGKDDYENIYGETLVVKRNISNKTCGTCYKVFGKLIERISHEDKVHGIVRKCYECRPCSEAFANALLLIKHSTAVHNIQFRKGEINPVIIQCLYQCEYCCRLYTKYKPMLNHKKTSCPSALSDKLTCYCSQSVTSTKHFSTHQTQHEESSDPLLQRPECNILFVCEYCYSTFKTTGKIFGHLKSKHPLQVAKAVIARKFVDIKSIPDMEPRVH